MPNATMVVGVFNNHASAEHALQALRDAGVEPASIGVAAPQRRATGDVAGGPSEHHGDEYHHVRFDETTGILAGGLLGGVAGWLIGAAVVAVPGVGALVAAGALAAAVSGSGLGAAAGALAGHFIEQGLSHAEAHYYREQVHQGSVIVTVTGASDPVAVRAIMRSHGGHDFHTRPTR